MPNLLVVGPSSRGAATALSRRRTTWTSGARRQTDGTAELPGQVWRIRQTQVVAALVGCVVGIESARLAFSTTWYAFGDTSTWSAVLGLAAGAALVVAGIIKLGSPASRTSAMLLAAAGMAWLI